MNKLLRLLSKALHRGRPAHTHVANDGALISHCEVVSAPGAVLRVERLHLTAQGRRLLSARVRCIG